MTAQQDCALHGDVKGGITPNKSVLASERYRVKGRRGEAFLLASKFARPYEDVQRCVPGHVLAAVEKALRKEAPAAAVLPEKELAGLWDESRMQPLTDSDSDSHSDSDSDSDNPNHHNNHNPNHHNNHNGGAAGLRMTWRRSRTARGCQRSMTAHDVAAQHDCA